MKIFLTGGSGFLGRQLIRDLVSRGDTVVALVRSVNSSNIVKSLGAAPVLGELSDKSIMEEAMEGCHAVIHAAAIVKMWGTRREFHTINVDDTRFVIDAARAAQVQRMVYIGTEAVLAEGKPIINANESTPLPYMQIGLYAETKALAEKKVLRSNSKSFTCISVRPRFIWGAGDTNLLPVMLDQMKKGSWCWFGGGLHKMSTCHVKNASHGILLALDRGLGGQAYFITDGEPVVFRDFITAMAMTQRVKPPYKSLPLWLAKLAAGYYEFIYKLFGKEGRLTRLAVNLFFQEVTVSDIKAQIELGYKPVVTIEEGLAEMEERPKGVKI